METEAAALSALFWTGLLSATLLPGGSEALFIAALQGAWTHPVKAWLTITLGNSLGGLSTWLLGYLIARGWWSQKDLNARFQPALARIRRHGGLALLFSWVPLVGDPLCLAAGWAGIPFGAAALFITLGKALRYAALWQLAKPWLN